MARPREFEPDKALELAMMQFRAKGYHDTSIRDLVERTGVNFYGLYGAFGNKHELFLAALDRYRDTITAEILETLQRPGPARDAVRRALERVLELMQTPDGRVGCLMCNTAIELAPHDPAAAAKVRAHMALVQRALRDRLAAGQSAGEFGPEADLDALAGFLTTTVYSVGLLVRAGKGDAEIRRHIAVALGVLR
jgi:TetR/AcrR family transcriptional repressor of nem operon